MAQRCTENTARYAQVLYLVRSVKDVNAEALRAWKWAGCDADHVTVQLICHSFKSLPPPASAPLLVKPALSPGSWSDLRTHKDSVVLLLNKYDTHVRRRTHNTQWVQTHNLYEVYYPQSAPKCYVCSLSVCSFCAPDGLSAFKILIVLIVMTTLKLAALILGGNYFVHVWTSVL